MNPPKELMQREEAEKPSSQSPQAGQIGKLGELRGHIVRRQTLTISFDASPTLFQMGCPPPFFNKKKKKKKKKKKEPFIIYSNDIPPPTLRLQFRPDFLAEETVA